MVIHHICLNLDFRIFFCVCRFGPIEYKGPLVSPYLENFILRVITPLTYLSSTATLKDFLSYHEVLLLSNAASEIQSAAVADLYVNCCVCEGRGCFCWAFSCV